MSISALYALLVLLPNSRNWLVVNSHILLIGMCVLLVILIVYAMNTSKWWPQFRKYMVMSIILYSLTTFVLIFVPTNSQMALIAGGYTVTNGPIAKLGASALQATEKFFNKLAESEAEPAPQEAATKERQASADQPKK